MMDTPQDIENCLLLTRAFLCCRSSQLTTLFARLITITKKQPAVHQRSLYLSIVTRLIEHNVYYLTGSAITDW